MYIFIFTYKYIQIDSFNWNSTVYRRSWAPKHTKHETESATYQDIMYIYICIQYAYLLHTHSLSLFSIYVCFVLLLLQLFEEHVPYIPVSVCWGVRKHWLRRWLLVQCCTPRPLACQGCRVFSCFESSPLSHGLIGLSKNYLKNSQDTVTIHLQIVWYINIYTHACIKSISICIYSNISRYMYIHILRGV